MINDRKDVVDQYKRSRNFSRRIDKNIKKAQQNRNCSQAFRRSNSMAVVVVKIGVMIIMRSFTLHVLQAIIQFFPNAKKCNFNCS